MENNRPVKFEMRLNPEVYDYFGKFENYRNIRKKSKLVKKFEIFIKNPKIIPHLKFLHFCEQEHFEILGAFQGSIFKNIFIYP